MSAQMLLLMADVIDGAGAWAGWTGAGLLGAVLFWLLYKHLPAKDKQITDFVEAKDRQVKDLTEIHTLQRRELLEAFRQEIRIEREHCAVHLDAARQQWDRERATLREERQAHHQDVVGRLDRLETAINEIRQTKRRQQQNPGPGATP